MTQLQEEFLEELKSKEKLTIIEYATLFGKHIQIAIDYELKNGASEHQAKAMGNYYTVTVLSDFVASENKLSRIIALHETM
ncbi:hypothetical protein [Sulfurimonas sp.]|jgi:hypothetical protein|uniref:hypothetical protein n=1 Tax=Sulfurimonas sp. TaxID=2022749 RepID=UPI0025E016E6|nr:hypothetical protein [Sulfurimonas sp.]MBT5934811.1 hypothetical protein [Sulfurimonas sp.]